MTQSSVARTLESDDEAKRAHQDFAQSIKNGLARKQKAIPSRFLYDARGSQLFEEITRLDEYYPTRTEFEILKQNASAMAATTPAGSALVEFGSGSSLKTEILLEKLDKLKTYVAIDISGNALLNATQRLAGAFPKLHVTPIVADFQKPVSLPCEIKESHKLGFFPGSTIGNFLPLKAVGLLKNMSRTLGPNSRLIIGVDMKKDRDTLLKAYNDSDGVTAAFNLNLLQRANTQLGADFDVDAFEHRAVYDETLGRIDMYLISRKRQSVRINGDVFDFAASERIHTEHSHKYDVASFKELAQQAGWKKRTIWSDINKRFSIFELTN